MVSVPDGFCGLNGVCELNEVCGLSGVCDLSGVLPKLGARACKLVYLTPGECSPVQPNAAPREQNVTHLGQNAAPVGQRELPAPKELVLRQHRSPSQAPGPSNRRGAGEGQHGKYNGKSLRRALEPSLSWGLFGGEPTLLAENQLFWRRTNLSRGDPGVLTR